MVDIREQNTLTGVEWIDTDPLFIAVGASLNKDAPQGVSLDDNDVFDAIDTEVMKRGTLNHASIRWDWVCEQCIELLKTEAKDFRLLLYILQSLPHIKKYNDPLPLGAVLISRFTAIWGEIAYPEPKKRVALMRKIVDATEQLAEYSLKIGPSPEFIDLTAQSFRQSADFFKRIDNSLGTKILSLPNKIEASLIREDDTGLPSLERMLKEPTKLKPMLEIKDSNGGNTPAMELHPENLVLNSKNERALKQSLTVVSDFLLNMDLNNPLSYRLRRFATWYGIKDKPEQRRKDDPRTVILPVSANALEEYRIAAERGQMNYEITQKLERSCHIQPFWIEGQYLAYKLATMCERKLAAAAIYDETVQFTLKIDWLNKLQFSDGTPFISEDTKNWIDNYKKSNIISGKSQENEMIGDKIQAIVRLAREKASQGHIDEAIKMLEQSRPTQDSIRSKTLWEMLMLECLSEWGMKNLVSSQAERLEKDIQEMFVKNFEPELLSRIQHLKLV